MQKLANQLPDSFADPKRVTKSYIPACNAPISIDVQDGHNQVATESKARLKRGRPIGSKDKRPRKLKKGAKETEVIDCPDKAEMAMPKYQPMRLGTPSLMVLKVLMMRSQLII